MKPMYKRRLVFLTVAAIILLFLSACQKKEDLSSSQETSIVDESSVMTEVEQSSEASKVQDSETSVETSEENTDETSPALGEQEEESLPEEEDFIMLITIGSYQFTVTLDESPTVEALKAKLPLTLSMSELNGNEKYNYLPFSLPTDSYMPGQIEEGDVMLYGDDCIVVFYKSFSSSYSYTKIGHIEDVTNLQEAVGTGSVEMMFE